MRQFCLFLVLICSAASFGQIKISSAKGVDLSSYKTFVVQKGQVLSLVPEEKINENKIFKVIQSAVVRELTERGYQAVDDSTAQLVISYVYKESLESTYQKAGPLGQTPSNDPSGIDGSSELSSALKERTLILEIVDAHTDNSLWTANCELSGAQKDATSLMDQTVFSALRKFPMQGKGKSRRR